MKGETIDVAGGTMNKQAVTLECLRASCVNREQKNQAGRVGFRFKVSIVSQIDVFRSGH